MRGLKDETEFVEKALDWDANVDTNFEEKFLCLPKVLAEGAWGKRCACFVHYLYLKDIKYSSENFMEKVSVFNPTQNFS